MEKGTCSKIDKDVIQDKVEANKGRTFFKVLPLFAFNPVFFHGTLQTKLASGEMAERFKALVC